ncbi:unnamed protein product [Caenorhabditis angaria]|uniref:F-box associated domain-containing protein n=1 Tax=Caenorhabditis angaria TaxID=860376 RepID=A0A9P1IIL8_9PELO|nr:unnamed protein product [Caenorhabditis angaria]
MFSFLYDSFEEITPEGKSSYKKRYVYDTISEDCETLLERWDDIPVEVKVIVLKNLDQETLVNYMMSGQTSFYIGLKVPMAFEILRMESDFEPVRIKCENKVNFKFFAGKEHCLVACEKRSKSNKTRDIFYLKSEIILGTTNHHAEARNALNEIVKNNTKRIKKLILRSPWPFDKSLCPSVYEKIEEIVFEVGCGGFAEWCRKNPVFLLTDRTYRFDYKDIVVSYDGTDRRLYSSTSSVPSVTNDLFEIPQFYGPKKLAVLQKHSINDQHFSQMHRLIAIRLDHVENITASGINQFLKNWQNEACDTLESCVLRMQKDFSIEEILQGLTPRHLTKDEMARVGFTPRFNEEFKSENNEELASAYISHCSSERKRKGLIIGFSGRNIKVWKNGTYKKYF